MYSPSAVDEFRWRLLESQRQNQASLGESEELAEGSQRSPEAQFGAAEQGDARTALEA